MGWISIRTTREKLVYGLLATEKGERAMFETVAHVDHGDILWVVKRVIARQDGTFGLKAGGSHTFILCYLIEQDLKEWGYKPIDESMGLNYYDCPLHFLDMAPVQCSVWREKVRAWHVEQAKQPSCQAA